MRRIPGDWAEVVGEEELASHLLVFEGASVEVLAAPVFVEAAVGVLREEVPDQAMDEIADDGGDVGFPLFQLLGAVVVETAEER